MTTRPSVDKARAYADALVAWAEGKRVEMRPISVAELPDRWASFQLVNDITQWEYRIAAAPPKLREFWVDADDIPADNVAQNARTFGKEMVSVRLGGLVHVREVSETADAEMDELRRNHDALCRAIRGLDAQTYAEVMHALRIAGVSLP